MISVTLPDPFRTDVVNDTYGYLSGNDSSFGPYFVVFSQGPRGDTTAPTFDPAHQWISYTGSGRAASNAPVVKLP